MKRMIYIMALAMMTAGFAACNGAQEKTGGAAADSGSHGSSGAADTVAKGATGTSAESTAGSDTSHNGKGTDAQTVDTTQKKKP